MPSSCELPLLPASSAGTRRWVWRAVVLLAIAGFSAMAIDVPLARWMLASPLSSDFAKLFLLAETFAHGAGVVLILSAVLVLDARPRIVLRMASAALLAGLAADCFKLLVGRLRPASFDFAGSVWTTFTAWLPGGMQPAAEQSFPSAHAATAAGLAVALSWAYPKGRWLFVTYAVLACGQRLIVSAHFASDVLLGAALGLAIAEWIVRGRFAAKWFDRFECRPARGNAAAEVENGRDRPARRVA